MDQVDVNVRYLLWRDKHPRESWAEILASWLRCELSRARKLLISGDYDETEISRVAEEHHIPEEELRFSDLLGQHQEISILTENLRFLIEQLERGSQKRLAEELGVTESTVSRWIGESRQPRPTNLARLQAFFGLNANVDLKTSPLFLMVGPVGESQRRQWIKQQVDKLDRESLNELFPALARLLDRP